MQRTRHDGRRQFPDERLYHRHVLSWIVFQVVGVLNVYACINYKFHHINSSQYLFQTFHTIASPLNLFEFCMQLHEGIWAGCLANGIVYPRVFFFICDYFTTHLNINIYTYIIYIYIYTYTYDIVIHPLMKSGILQGSLVNNVPRHTNSYVNTDVLFIDYEMCSPMLKSIYITHPFWTKVTTTLQTKNARHFPCMKMSISYFPINHLHSDKFLLTISHGVVIGYQYLSQVPEPILNDHKKDPENTYWLF